MSEVQEENSDLKLSFQKATEELKVWLEYKQISDIKRGEAIDNIGRLMVAMAHGRLILDPETKVFTQKLKFPVGKDGAITELKFKPRITASDVQGRLAEVRENDGVGRVLAYVGAATGEISAIVGALDSEDYHLSADIVFFFMIPA